MPSQESDAIGYQSATKRANTPHSKPLSPNATYSGSRGVRFSRFSLVWCSPSLLISGSKVRVLDGPPTNQQVSGYPWGARDPADVTL